MSSHLLILGAREAGGLRRDDFHETPEIATRKLLSVEDFVGPITDQIQVRLWLQSGEADAYFEEWQQMYLRSRTKALH